MTSPIELMARKRSVLWPAIESCSVDQRIQKVGHPDPDDEVNDVAQQDAIEVEIALVNLNDLRGRSALAGPRSYSFGRFNKIGMKRTNMRGSVIIARFEDSGESPYPRRRRPGDRASGWPCIRAKGEPEHEADEVGGNKNCRSKENAGDGNNGRRVTAKSTSDRCCMVWGYGGAIRSRLSHLHCGRGHLGSPSVAALGGATCGNVAPLPISRNCGGG